MEGPKGFYSRVIADYPSLAFNFLVPPKGLRTFNIGSLFPGFWKGPILTGQAPFISHLRETGIAAGGIFFTKTREVGQISRGINSFTALVWKKKACKKGKKGFGELCAHWALEGIPGPLVVGFPLGKRGFANALVWALVFGRA